MTLTKLKRCCDCSKHKRADVLLPVECFYRSSRSADGLQDICKSCANRRSAQWRKANLERARATERARYRRQTLARLKELHDAQTA